MYSFPDLEPFCYSMFSNFSMVGGAKSCLESNPILTRDAQRAQTKPCAHQNPGERSSDPSRDWSRLACGVWVSRSLQQRCGLSVACCRDGGTECGSACMGPSEGGHHYLRYLHHSLVLGQTMGREHSPAHQQKIYLKTWPYAPRGEGGKTTLSWKPLI